MITMAEPLSAGFIMMESFCLSSFRAFLSSFVRLGVSGSECKSFRSCLSCSINSRINGSRLWVGGSQMEVGLNGLKVLESFSS